MVTTLAAPTPVLAPCPRGARVVITKGRWAGHRGRLLRTSVTAGTSVVWLDAPVMRASGVICQDVWCWTQYLEPEVSNG